MQVLGNVKRATVFVDYDKALPRDELMYKFDKETVRKIKLHLKKQDFSFSSYLPNGLNKTVDYSS